MNEQQFVNPMDDFWPADSRTDFVMVREFNGVRQVAVWRTMRGSDGVIVREH